MITRFVISTVSKTSNSICLFFFLASEFMQISPVQYAAINIMLRIECVYALMLFFMKEYIHRVGRTARGDGGVGHALLILRPEELGFLRYLKHAKVPLNEFDFSWSKISNIQAQVSR